MRLRPMLILAWMLLAAAPALAVEPDEMLSDPALEARAREISKEVRCLVCQNQDIDSSNADLARDLRLLIRERLEAGDSDREVLDFLVARYGDYVLLNPPVKPSTYLLWFGPLLLLLGGSAAVALYLRRRRRLGGEETDATPLSEEEEKRGLEILQRGPRR